MSQLMSTTLKWCMHDYVEVILGRDIKEIKRDIKGLLQIKIIG